MLANGPAIWGGCVPPAGGWRTFCRLIASEVLAKKAGYNFYCVKARSRYKHYEFVLRAGAVCKNRDNSTYLYCPC